MGQLNQDGRHDDPFHYRTPAIVGMPHRGVGASRIDLENEAELLMKRSE